MSAPRWWAPVGLALMVAASAVAAAPPAGELAGSRNGSPIWVRASLEPAVAQLGQRVIYRGRVTISYNETRVPVQWMLPEADSTITWGSLKPRIVHSQTEPRRSGTAAHRPNRDTAFSDTLFVEAPVQVFRTGIVTIPGLRFRFQDPVHPDTYRLPGVNLIVTSVLGPADSNADLRPMRGPLAAPWWERVPWFWVVLGLVVAGVVITLVVLRRRRRPVVAASAPVKAAARRDPAAEALAALAALRAQQLPARGRFAEHAFELSGIARRFLEATAGTTRPGDTTPELVRHLEGAGLDAEDVKRVAGLLRAWDRVKFARAPSTADEARREEDAVEALARRRVNEPAERVA